MSNVETCPRCGCVFGSHWSARIAELEAKVAQAQKDARKWQARRQSAEQKLGYEEKLRGEAEAEVAKWKFMLQFISERTTAGAALVESAYQNYAGSPRLSDAELKRRLASDGYNPARAEETM